MSVDERDLEIIELKMLLAGEQALGDMLAQSNDKIGKHLVRVMKALDALGADADPVFWADELWEARDYLERLSAESEGC